MQETPKSIFNRLTFALLSNILVGLKCIVETRGNDLGRKNEQGYIGQSAGELGTTTPTVSTTGKVWVIAHEIIIIIACVQLPKVQSTPSSNGA